MFSLNLGKSSIYHKFTLTFCFVLWKLLLLCVALSSPGLGYDTSTTLLEPGLGFAEIKASSGRDFAAKFDCLIRWDAVYFTQIARRGYLWEQEWAFSWSFTKLLGFIGRGRQVSWNYYVLC